MINSLCGSVLFLLHVFALVKVGVFEGVLTVEVGETLIVLLTLGTVHWVASFKLDMNVCAWLWYHVLPRAVQLLSLVGCSFLTGNAGALHLGQR